MKEINGQITRQCGDINLVAAMMACGIMLNPSKPCIVLESEDGRNYASYIYLQHGVDGKTTSDQLMAHWGGHITLPPDDGFPAICEFIKARPRGIQRSNDLLDFAIQYLADRGEPVTGLKTFDGIPDFVNKSHKCRAQFILAYIWNREICYQLHKKVGRSVHLGDATRDGGRCAVISENLPAWQRKELISRYLG